MSTERFKIKLIILIKIAFVFFAPDITTRIFRNIGELETVILAVLLHVLPKDKALYLVQNP